MKVNSVTVTDFRNYTNKKVEFDDGINVLCGKNGVGKTNLLEGIFLFAGGKSFRGAKDKEMIRFGCEKGEIVLDFENNGGKNSLKEVIFKNKKKELYKNGWQLTKLSEYLGLFRCVVFAPDHMELIKGGPENRRRFLDLAMCQSFPRYVAMLSEYNKTLIRKNACLKSENPDPILIDIYNERLAALGATITKSRNSFVTRLDSKIRDIYFDMSSGREKIKLEFFSQVGNDTSTDILKTKYLELLSAKKETEIARKCSFYGAQRDDFYIYINDKNARLYGSQGQQRSAVLSLKLAEGCLLEEYTGEPCVYLLDDILSELDASRKEFILQRLTGKQFIITCCEETDSVKGKIIRI